MGEKKKGRGEGDKAHRLRAYYPSKISDIAYVTSAHPRAGLRRAEHHQPIHRPERRILAGACIGIKLKSVYSTRMSRMILCKVSGSRQCEWKLIRTLKCTGYRRTRDDYRVRTTKQ